MKTNPSEFSAREVVSLLCAAALALPSAVLADTTPPSCADRCARLIHCLEQDAPVDLCPDLPAGTLPADTCAEQCSAEPMSFDTFDMSAACPDVVAQATAVDPGLAAACTGHYPSAPGCDALVVSIHRCVLRTCPTADGLGAGLDAYLALSCSDPLDGSPPADAAEIAALDCDDPRLATWVSRQLESPSGALASFCAHGRALPEAVCANACALESSCFPTHDGTEALCPTMCALNSSMASVNGCAAMATTCEAVESCIATLSPPNLPPSP